eukprot:10497883-Alexandrium_andersonii.AAC.1
MAGAGQETSKGNGRANTQSDWWTERRANGEIDTSTDGYGEREHIRTTGNMDNRRGRDVELEQNTAS